MSETPATPAEPRISEPAVRAAGGRGKSPLLTYEELYLLWEREQWRVQDLDFARDRADWNEGLSKPERLRRLYALCTFFLAEQRVAADLAPIMGAAPGEPMRIFLCTQIADEARHAAFFDRFHEEVGALRPGSLDTRLAETRAYIGPDFDALFDEMLHRRVERLVIEPEDLEALVEAITVYHMVVEGMAGITGQHFMSLWNRAEGLLPGLVEGLEYTMRDERRHIAFGARFLHDTALDDAGLQSAVRRALAEAAPVADLQLTSPWHDERSPALEGMRRELRTFAWRSLERRMKAIGLGQALPPAPSLGLPLGARLRAVPAHGRRAVRRMRARAKIRSRLRDAVTRRSA